MIVILCIRPYFPEQDADLRLQNFSAFFRQPLVFPQLGVNGVLAQDRPKGPVMYNLHFIAVLGLFHNCSKQTDITYKAIRMPNNVLIILNSHILK